MTRNAVLAGISLLAVWVTLEAKPLPDKPGTPQPIRPFEIEELGKKVFHISFPAGEKATIRVKSVDDTDVDLFVEEMDGTEVVQDVDESKDCLVEFTPLKKKTYRVSVINIGPGGNKCTLTHTGQVENPDFGKLVQTKPVNIAENATHILKIPLKEGQMSAVWVTSERATDVDLFVFDPDGNEVAKDEHFSKDAFVSFVPKQTGAYRVEVKNLGEGENTCTVKHTSAEENKK